MEQSKDTRWAVVSFYTPDYKSVADRLIRSLKEFDIPFFIEEVPQRGSWFANVYQKPQFILKMMKKLKRPVVWIDADAKVLSYPKLFDVIEEDMAVYFENLQRLLSGTVYFKYTKAALHTVKRWAKNTNHETKILNQKHLEFVVRSEYLEAHNMSLFFLPQSYCKVFDQRGAAKPVIEHYQASRRFRVGASKEGP